ncbi:MAG TPA: hypothetical protein PLU59_03565, partial [Aliarcobacter cryaerophilus]|nr:hypothetical protein [Aliarcobacter cryaerophilus]
MIEKYNIFKEIPIDKSEEKFFEIFKNDKIKICFTLKNLVKDIQRYKKNLQVFTRRFIIFQLDWI